MNIHASLVADLFLHNFNWFYEVLRSRTYTHRDMFSRQVVKYRFDLEEIDKVYIWTENLKSGVSKIKALNFLGYDTRIINSINLYDSFYNPKNDKNKEITNRFIRASKHHPIYLCFGPLFINDYVDLDWHKGQLRFLWKVLSKHSQGLYLDFNVNSSLEDSNKYKGRRFTKEEAEELIDFAERLVGEVYLKPSYYDIDRKKNFDIGEENFCLTGSYLNEGIYDRGIHRAKRALHYPSSDSLILTERNEEVLVEKRLIDGLVRSNDVKKAEKKKKEEEKRVDFFENSDSLFDMLDCS